MRSAFSRVLAPLSKVARVATFVVPWSYLSTLPERTTTAPLDPADVSLGASGMSVDRAWTHGTGRDDVRIAVLSAGSAWGARALDRRVALNAAELTGPRKPQDAAGGACGGAGPLAGYDCNGDGVFDVTDYASDPRITPRLAGDACFVDAERTRTGADRIAGDANRNCVLDPGDLVLLFSDGVDDDANGYVDDIAGWDFLKNDNDPFDDTASNAGALAATWANAESIDGGVPGTCPGCRHLVLRVGDGAVADATDVGMAVVYAADQGAQVIQVSGSTVNDSPFFRDALDYAYAKGSLVVTGMGVTGSRGQEAPATSAHVLAVSTLRHDAATPDAASTFLAFDTCSSSGAHARVAISASECGSAGVGRAAGIAGLLFSVAADRSVTLRPGEALQLFTTYADDVNVEGSRAHGSRRQPSQPGFDARFGYGRANAARMVEAIEAGHLPPEVEITSPGWYAPAFADRLGGLIAITGEISAARAATYDYRVQWAPGLQPLDEDYRDLVAPVTGALGGTVSGGTTPLAQLDPKQIDTTHTPDPDAKLGEDARSISIRVQAVAHYADGDVRGEARRVVTVANDANAGDDDLLPGFPLDLGASLESSPKVTDVDGDGSPEIVVGDASGRLHAIVTRAGASASELPGFPYLTRLADGLNPTLPEEPTVPSYLSAPAYKAGAGAGVDPRVARESIVSAPAVADLDGDGRNEIVFATLPGTVYAVRADGSNLVGWPKRLPLVPSCPLHALPTTPARCTSPTRPIGRGIQGSPVLVDLTGDGRPEVVVAAFDGSVWVYRADGEVLDGFPVELATPGTKPARILSTPTVVDLNGDGIPEIVSGANQVLSLAGDAGPVYAVDGRGTRAPGGPFLPNWPVILRSARLVPGLAEGVSVSQAAVDLDRDGVSEIVLHGHGGQPLVLAADPGRSTDPWSEPPNRLPVVTDARGRVRKGLAPSDALGALSKVEPDSIVPFFAQPSVGDVDQDGVPDVVVSGGSGDVRRALAGSGERLALQYAVTVYSGRTGAVLPGMPALLEDHGIFVDQVVADVNADGYPEVLVGTGGGRLHAYDGCGREPKGFPKTTGEAIAASAAVGDLGDDGVLDVVVGTRGGHLHAWRTKAPRDGVVEWPSFHHDDANTGSYATRLGPGAKKRAAGPLVCDGGDDGEVGRLDGAGGCVCGLARGHGSGATATAGVLGMALVLAARRRRAKA